MCEPIQGGLPNSKSVEYIVELDKYCKKNNIIFLLDEIISGLRFQNGSFQRLKNIKSDISTFGKAFGGGFPIGFIGISKKIDQIIKSKNLNILYGGTFSGNSLMCHFGVNFLDYYLKNKSKITTEINKKAAYFSNEMNSF